MTFRAPSRFAGLAPSLVLAVSVLVSACATQPTQPPAPIQTGENRTTPRDRTDDQRDPRGQDSADTQDDDDAMPISDRERATLDGSRGKSKT